MKPLYPILLAVTVLTTLPAAMAAGDSHLMRYADIHAGQVVFTYEDDLWLVPAAGGKARRITRHPGAERYAKFSPDGTKIAFTGQYDGGRDVYVMDAGGGVPTRLTWHPSDDRVLGWHPSGDSVLFRSRREYPGRGEQAYLVPVTGGMPRRLAVDRAGLADLSPDGKRIAYNRISREDRPWKRYRGGMAQDIWLGTLGEGDFRKITNWDGSDNYPMWHGDSIYFISDRDGGTFNLFRYDTASGAITGLTGYRDYDIKYPSIGPENIVFQYAESLHVYSLETSEVRKVPVAVPSDRVPVRPEHAGIEGHTGSFALSPDGERLLLEARGEILSVPAEEGRVFNLTDSSSTREKSAAWSPDGERVAYLSDASSEEELYLVDPRGETGPKRLTEGGKGFRLQPVWSPDSRHLLFSDKFMRLNLVDAGTGEIRVIAQGEYDEGWFRWGIQDYVWSPCSRWIAYSMLERSLYESIFLYSLDTGETHRVTGEVTADWSPSFDPEGRYLYFLSNRTFNPVMGHVDQTHVFLDMTRPYVFLLRADEPSPFAEKDDAVAAEKAPEKSESMAAKEDSAAGDAKEPTRIDLADTARRIVPVQGVDPGNYFRLEATASGFLYLARTGNHFIKYQEVGDTTATRLDLHGYDLEERKQEKLISGINNYHLSADGEKLVYRSGDRYGVVAAGKQAKPGDGLVSLEDIRLRVVRLEEYLQIFNEAWRVQRDWFYDPGMHGVDWDRIGEKYRIFVKDCGNRADLNYLIAEMISELNSGHTYVGGGEFDPGPGRVPVGMLGADFEQPAGSDRHRIAHIVQGNNWHPGERSPLEEPGCDVNEGDYLVSIDGREILASDNIYRFLENKVGETVVLEFASKPDRGEPGTCRVRPIRSENRIRYREWVEGNRVRVDQASGGRIGYLHIPDMMGSGLVEFARAWYPHYYKKAFVIDDRYNSGGFVGDMIIDRLERRLWSYTKPREGKPIPDPERCFDGPLAVLINEETGSNGEYFAEAVKIKGLGTVIGMRTWGGAVGIEPHQDLVDGGVTTPPQFAPFGRAGTWLIEGRGVEPDVEVQNMPGDVLQGRDAQLSRAVEMLLEKISDAETVPVPTYPDKSKPGEGVRK